MSRRNRRTPAAGFSIAALQVLIAGVCWFPCRVVAADVSAPWFHATFDGTQKVTQAGKEAYPVTRVELKYDEGPVGKGIVLAPMGQQLVYRQGEFPLAAGTIVLWVKPLLDPNDYSVFFIFAKSSDDGSYDCPNDRTWIYLTSSPTLGRVLRVYMTDDKNSYGTTLEWPVTPETWKVGQWKHLAWTWGDGVTTLYVDGSVVQSGRCLPPKVRGKVFRLGAAEHMSYSMDDFRIYGESLSKEEVASLYQLGNPPAAPVAKVPSTPPASNVNRYTYVSGEKAYLSPSMPVRLFFARPIKIEGMPDYMSKEPCRFILDVPAGISVVGASLFCKELPLASENIKKTGTQIWGSSAFTRYELTIEPYGVPMYNMDLHVYLSTTMKPGSTTTIYYHDYYVEQKSPVLMSLPVEIIDIHQVKNRPRRLLVGEGWIYEAALTACPKFEKHYTSVGMNLVGLPLKYLSRQPVVERAERVKRFVKRCDAAAISVAAVLNPLTDMRLAIGGEKSHPEVQPRNSDGELFLHQKIGNIVAFCPSYRGPLFEQAMLQTMRNVAAHGMSCVFFDYELGFGSTQCESGNNYVCFCDRCLAKFKQFMAAQYPQLEYRDPREFEAGFFDYPKYHEAWKLFMCGQIAEWFALQKRTFTEAVQEHKAKSSPGVWFGDYGHPCTWEEAHASIWYAEMNLKNGLDFVMPAYYTPTTAESLSIIATDQAAFRARFPASKIICWTTAGYSGDSAAITPEMWRYRLNAIFASGIRGLVFYDETGFDGLELDILSRVVDAFASVEDIIIDGSRVTPACDDLEAVAYGQKKGDEMVLLVAEYGKQPKQITVSIPVDKPCGVFDLASGTRLGDVSPQAPRFKVNLGKDRQALLHIK